MVHEKFDAFKLGAPEKISLSEPQRAPEHGDIVSHAEALRIFKNDYFGPDEIGPLLGTTLTAEPIPFSYSELERAKQDGMQLVYYADHMVDCNGKRVPITINMLPRRFKTTANGAQLYDTFSKVGFAQYKNAPQTAGWKLVSKYPLPDSAHKTYLAQTDLMVAELKRLFGKDMPLPYQQAIEEFETRRATIERNLSLHADDRKAGKLLASLRLTHLFRETPIEAVYRLVLNDQLRVPLMMNEFIWTSFWQPVGNHFVYVSNAENGTVMFDDTNAYNQRLPIGLSLSRGPLS